MASCVEYEKPTPIERPGPSDLPPVAVAAEATVISGFSSWTGTSDFALYWKRTENYSSPSRYNVVAASIDNEKGKAGFAGELMWDASKQQQFFYAITPWQGSQSADPTLQTVSLPAVQTQNGRSADHLGAINTMIAKPITGIAPDFATGEPKTPIKLDFTPLFATLEVRLIAYNNEPVTINSMKIESTQPESVPYTLTGATVDLTTPAIDPAFRELDGGTAGYSVQLDFDGGATLQSTDDGFELSNPDSPASERFLPARVVMLPGNYSAGGDMRFTFETGAGQFVVERRALSLNRDNSNIITVVVPVTPIDV